MKNKNLYIGLGVLAVAGVSFYLWKKNKKVSEEKEEFTGKKDGLKQTGYFGSQTRYGTFSATGNTESISDLDLEKSKNYRDDIKEIAPVNYSQVNKGFYYGIDGRRVVRITNIRTNIA